MQVVYPHPATFIRLTGARSIAFLGYMIKYGSLLCKTGDKIISASFLFFNLVPLHPRNAMIQCCWCGYINLLGIKLVLSSHIYHQCFHTEEYREIFVINLCGLL